MNCYKCGSSYDKGRNFVGDSEKWCRRNVERSSCGPIWAADTHMHKDCFEIIAVLKELVITTTYLTCECTEMFVVS